MSLDATTVDFFQGVIGTYLAGPRSAAVRVLVFARRRNPRFDCSVVLFCSRQVPGVCLGASLQVKCVLPPDTERDFFAALRTGTGFRRIVSAREIRARLTQFADLLQPRPSTRWPSTVVLGHKSGGYWADLALQALNAEPQPDAYPARLVDCMVRLDQLADRRQYSALDLEESRSMDNLLPSDFGHISFRTLALDILSGVPQERAHHGGEFEVWGYRGHPEAVAVLRFFENRRAVIFASAMSALVEQEGLFTAQFLSYVSTQVAPIVGRASPAASAWPVLERLPCSVSFERLGWILSLIAQGECVTSCSQIYGEISDLSVDRLGDLLAIEQPRTSHVNPSERLLALTERIAQSPPSFLGGKSRSLRGREWVDVMRSEKSPSYLVLIHHGPAETHVFAYSPQKRAALAVAKLRGQVEAIVDAHDLFGANPKPLTDMAGCVRLTRAGAYAATMKLAEALRHKEDAMILHMSQTIAEAPQEAKRHADSTATAMYVPENARLH